MSSRFSRDNDTDIEDEAARAEVERLKSLPVIDLAIGIMEVFGPEVPSQVVSGSDPSIAQADIARWLLRDYPRGPRYLPLLRAAVREACRALIRIALLQQGPPSYAVGAGGEVVGSTSGRVSPTRLAARLLAQGDLEQWARQHWESEHLSAAPVGFLDDEIMSAFFDDQ